MKHATTVKFLTCLAVASSLFIAKPAKSQYTLQVLHASDLEGGVDAIERAPNFAAIIDKLDDEYPNTLILGAGDTYIPGPFFSASADGSVRQTLRDFYNEFYGGIEINSLREGAGRIDISIMNAIGFDASALGNHEFDAGTGAIAEIIGADFGSDGVRWMGSQFPFLSANLDFSADDALNGLYTPSLELNTFFQSNPNTMMEGEKRSIAPATLINRGGELIGVVGATTPLLESISSPGLTQVQNPGAGTNNMESLASILQPVINELMAAGSNKIILVSHLQQVQLEEELIGLLSGVDIIIAGGSDVILANPGDVLNPGDENHIYSSYPISTQNADGDPAAIVSTDGEYSYVGRLVVNFDDAGILDLSSIAPVSGPYASTETTVAELWGSLDAAFADGTTGSQVSTLTDAVLEIVTEKDGNIFGKSHVFLEGRRSAVRTEETNLGNFTADANLWFARKIDPSTTVSIKNGGGIRAAIGEVVQLENGEYTFFPPQENAISGKMDGEISQLDIENSMRFNNALSLISVSAENLKAILEHGVAGWAPGATPGSFAQVGGVRFSFDPSLPANNRIVNAVLLDEDGNDADALVENGIVTGDPERIIRVVTLNFLAGGGDGYPFDELGFDQFDLVGNTPVEITENGVANFADSGTEQDAFAEYAAELYSFEPFNVPETAVAQDGRIQNLSFRSDAIFSEAAEVEFDEKYANVEEGSGILEIEVLVNNPRDETVLISLLPSAASTAIEGTNYTIGSGIEAPAGESVITFTIEILDDNELGGKFIALQFAPTEGIAPGDDDTFVVLISDNDKAPVLPQSNPSLTMSVITSLTTPNGAVAEISAYDVASQRLFVTNAEDNQLFIYDISDVTTTNIIETVEITPYGGNINSVAVYNGIVAVAVEAEETGINGSVLFLDIDGNELNNITVGFMPDMVVFNNDGTKVLTANEGEPNADYDLDPVGSISIIDISGGIESLTAANVSEAGFESFNDQAEVLRLAGVRIFGPNASVAQDLEPEYIAISADNQTAYVTLQENNAVAVVNIASATVTNIYPLGYKDLSNNNNQLDVSDKNDAIFMATWENLKGMYMPDAISRFNIEGVEYLITANEGDARDYDGYVDEERAKDLDLDPAAFPFADILMRNELLGRLNVTNADGDHNEDGLYEELYAYGGRSFSIWNATNGNLVFDSGDKIESAIASDPIWASAFNSNDDEIELKSRSDAKGPEPEGVTVGVVNGKTYAFVLLERMAGVMAWDVSNPNEPIFVQYLNNRDTEDGELGDLAPEGVIFISADDSPNGENLLLVSNEVSGTITVISLQGMDEPEACTNYNYYLANVDENSVSTIYGVVLNDDDTTADLTELATLDYEVHIAFNESEELLYLIRSEGGDYRTLDVSVTNGAMSVEMALSTSLPKVTAAAFNADSKLLLGDTNTDEIVCVNTTTGVVSPFASGVVSGGDITFGHDGRVYLASRNANILYEVNTVGANVMIGNVPPSVTGLATMLNGDLIVSAQNSSSLDVRSPEGANNGIAYDMFLNGEVFTSYDGDLASGCSENNQVVEDCNYQLYLTNQPVGGSYSMYGVSLNADGSTVLNTLLSDLPSTHIALSPNGEQIYLVGTSDLKTYDVASGTIINSVNIQTASGTNLTGFPALVISTEGVLYGAVGNKVYTIGFDGIATQYGPNRSVNGGDLVFIDSELWLVNRNSGIFTNILSGASFDVNLTDINGAAVLENGNILLSDGNGSGLLKELDVHSLEIIATYETGLSLFNGDMAGRCILNEETTTPILSNVEHMSDDYLSSYPNPTTGTSQVVFVLNEKAEATLEVFDMNGRSVAKLFNQTVDAGTEYLVDFNGNYLPNGIYVYRLTTNKNTTIEKFLIAR